VKNSLAESNRSTRVVSIAEVGYDHLAQDEKSKKDYQAIPKLSLAEGVPMIEGPTDKDGKHGSMVTIFSAWNSMAGVGILTMPWAFQQAGVVMGIFLCTFAFLASFYCCYLVIKTAGADVDYTDTLKKQFGKTGWTIGMIAFILNFYVPVLLFFQLLAQNLYPVILVVIYLFTGEERDIDLKPDWSQFSYSWTCVIIFFLTLGLASYRDL